MDFVKKKNEKEHFVETTIGRIGYPRWDKIIVRKKPEAMGRGAIDSSSTFYIPFVRDSQNYVNASMVIRTSPADTTLRYLCDWQYSQRVRSATPVDTAAESYALFFMLMDKKVFAHNKFVITDTTLFAGQPKENDTTLRKVYLLNDPGHAGRGSLVIYEECLSYAVCGSPSYCSAHGGCDFQNCVSNPDICYSFEICWQYDDAAGFIFESTGTAGTSGSGGGGGTSGGGSTPPDCGGIPAARGMVVQGCEPGWHPDYSLTPAQMVIASQLINIARPGDQFYFQNNLNINQSLVFPSVSGFQNYLQVLNAAATWELNSPAFIINQNEKFEHARYNLTLIGGIDISCKLSKAGSIWLLSNVTSSDYGVTIGWEWQQSDYSQSVSGNEITVIVEGYIKYNVIFDGWGTVYKQRNRFQIKINNITGEITSRVKL